MLDDFEPFESPKLLVRAAKEDILKIKAACDAFIEGNVYAPVEQVDPHTKEKVIKLRFNKRVPGELMVLFSRVINDLRHTLDQATCDSAAFFGVTNRSGIYFPFGVDEHDFAAKVKDHCKKLRPELGAFIAAFKPYFGGDSFLWSLTRLAARIHQRIIGLSTDADAFYLDSHGLNITGPVTLGINKWNDHRNELEFARVGPGGHIQMQLNIPFHVVVGKADVVQGEPVPALLDRYASKVESIVNAIEAEAIRLKGI